MVEISAGILKKVIKNKMIKALENPHFKKIWEEVNWKVRHPDAKSLYSALMVEMEEPSAYGVVMRRASRDYGMSIMFRDMYKIDKCNTTQRPKIIGRPITLFNVLHLLNKKHWLYVADDTKIYFIDKNVKGTKIFCDFTSNLLEEQTPETWEKIANLI